MNTRKSNPIMKPPNRSDYIFAQEKRREVVTINRFFAGYSGDLSRWFSPTLKWDLPFVWLGLRIPHERLLRGFSGRPKPFLGDVDVLGANLEASSPQEYKDYVDKVAEIFEHQGHPSQIINQAVQWMIREGKVKWPPDLSYIAATEVKAAYFSADLDLKAAGDKYNGRHQAGELCEMGFDRVALARFVVTEPVEVEGHHPWRVASVLSSMAMKDYLDDAKGIFIKENDPYGTILITTGAVLGKLEHFAGSMGAKWLQEVPDNPLREQAAESHKVIETNLLYVMRQFPFPNTFPVLILACSDDKCGYLYVTGAGPDANCPQCGKEPR